MSLMPLVAMILLISFSSNALMGGIAESVSKKNHILPKDQASSESSSGCSS